MGIYTFQQQIKSYLVNYLNNDIFKSSLNSTIAMNYAYNTQQDLASLFILSFRPADSQHPLVAGLISGSPVPQQGYGNPSYAIAELIVDVDWASEKFKQAENILTIEIVKAMINLRDQKIKADPVDHGRIDKDTSSTKVYKINVQQDILAEVENLEDKYIHKLIFNIRTKYIN